MRKENCKHERIFISISKDGITLNTAGHLFKKAMAVGSKLKTFPWIIGVEVPQIIGDHFGGLLDVASETLNLINVNEARIQVKKNVCAFVPSTVELLPSLLYYQSCCSSGINVSSMIKQDIGQKLCVQ